MLVIRWTVAICVFVLQAYAAVQDPASLREYDNFTNRSLLWAPYRANCYFGVRPRYVNAEPFLMGLMWMNTKTVEAIGKIRHFVDTQDDMTKYGWEMYDPRIGGKQVILDTVNNLNLTIYFVKSHDGVNWGFRVRGEALDKSSPLDSASIIYYMKQNGDSKENYLTSEQVTSDNKLRLTGYSGELGEYEVLISTVKGNSYKKAKVLSSEADPSRIAHLSMVVPDDRVWNANEIFQSLLVDSIQQYMAESDEDVELLQIPSAMTIRNIHNFAPSKFHFVQKTFDISESPFEIDFLYNKKGSQNPISSVDELIKPVLDTIRSKFDSRFEIKDARVRQFAIETLSNLIGGLSYFHGKQLVDRKTVFDEELFSSIELNHPEEEGPHDLFTFVPSRASYPRGFYWDEGFHLLQVMEYDFDLALEVLRSWLGLVEDDSGWIARELILGEEARSKVPKEFQTQNPHIANPPTLALAFSEMLNEVLGSGLLHFDLTDENLGSFSGNSGETLKKDHELLAAYSERLYEKLLAQFNWFRSTQRGMTEEYLDLADVDEDSIHVEDAYHWVGRTFTHCLPSGLDDYPRAQPPDMAELHVDALSWVGIMSRSMKQIAAILGRHQDAERFHKIEQNVIDNLNNLHWSEEHQSYCDLSIDDDLDTRKFVCHEGYVTLMPFALKLIATEDERRIRRMVEVLSDPDRLLSDFGIRSLSKMDEYYETGEVYWRGPIWVNINYLCIDALRYYFGEESDAEKYDHKLVKQAKQLYHQLRNNLLNNIIDVWEKDGYCYEQYNQNDGKGQRVQHFTGWTALAVNLAGKFPEYI
ncbi:AFR483Cp [Eremothecium gossypii ATCC 10895]|uniref:Mannosyl-oligosaccharide glucosidase n=1 Tax=Eremothecium gossypii (strain ATCC 10895 / CBS 109.51 / FGSC 9923 / NRRL Y-1056) TaxID=284811 RepID=Q752U0_EREGS|nr:AFR483Cp [Eremothecium gossypii ATCC 10895]AAS53854.2 AFR483Cp [Eremothecium gossypii ATCC 10895]